MWESIKSFFRSLFAKAGRVSYSFASAFLSYVAANVDDALAEAARAGYEAAEKSDKKGLDKLSYAASVAVAKLGTAAAGYAFGAIVTACQMAWAEAQKDG